MLSSKFSINNVTSMRKYITFGAPLLERKELKAVSDCLKSGWIGTGPKVQLFEKEFSRYKNSKYSIAVNSCTAALHLSLKALDLKPGDEVITTSLTFCSTINSIIHSGAKPVLADVDYKSQNIDPKKILEKITKKTKALVIVHFAGLPCNMKEIMKIKKDYKLKLIEDCAHAIESKYNNQHCGTFGDYGCFSFYATKNLVTGEGGMITSNKEKIISKLKSLALHGMNKDAWKRFSDKGFKHYDVQDCGFKYNMMDLQATIGIEQLKKINKFYKIRKKIWNLYNQEFKSFNLTLPPKTDSKSVHGLHLYTLQLDKKKCGISRDEFISKLHELKIGTGVHYRSIPEHSYYKKNYKWKLNDYPNAAKIGRETVSIPLSAKLNKNDLDYIVTSIKRVLKNV